MDANAQYELYLIKKELQGIITELDNIANGVRRDFCGIGNDKCANSIASSAIHYRDVKAQLEKMDLSALSDEFIAKKQEEERKAATAQAQKQSSTTTRANTTTKTSSQNTNSTKSTQTTNTSTSKSSKSMVETVEEGLKNIGNAIKGVFSWFK